MGRWEVTRVQRALISWLKYKHQIVHEIGKQAQQYNAMQLKACCCRCSDRCITRAQLPAAGASARHGGRTALQELRKEA